MAVQFILGRSGTGKTSYCIKAIVDALSADSDRPLVFLVPEQATYQAERAILADRRILGYNRLQVLSFDRLVFLLLGKNTVRPGVSRIGRQMIVHRILRDNSNKLRLFGSSTDSPGLSRRIAQTIIELHQYAKTPDDIELLLGKLRQDESKTLTAMKLADIELVLSEYLKFIQGRFIDPDLQLRSACSAIQDAAFIRGAGLWVDGFASFTANELALLGEMLKVVAHAQIALCLDPAGVNLKNPGLLIPSDSTFFDPTRRTYCALVEIIAGSKLQLREPLVLRQPFRFSQCPPLTHVERNIFDLDAPRIKADGNVSIVAAPSRRSEVRFVANEILKLVKQRKWRYRDIAVIASDIDSYEHYITAHFLDHGIPFFIDKPKLLNQHPVAHLICSVLGVITGGFAHNDVFACLKSELVPLSRFHVDLLENYCLAFGVTPGDWLCAEPWRFAPADSKDFDQELVERIRCQAIEPLLGLRDALCPADSPQKKLTPEEFTRAIFAFLDTLDIRRTLGHWIDESAGAGDYAKADEHRQFFDRLVDLFDELVEAFSGREMSADDYFGLIKSAFAQMTLALVPPRLDQVLIGSIERSRHPDLRAVFLVGATQKNFPVPVSEQTVLTDDDRSAVESEDFYLAPAVSQAFIERQYLAYIAFTRPCEFLCITYPCVDDKGSLLTHSQFIDQLQSLFENLQEHTLATEQMDVEDVHSRTELAELLCNRLGRDVFSREAGQAEHLAGLLADICSDSDLRDLGSFISSAVNYDNNANLDGDVVRQLFPRTVRSSSGRLSTFASCPYQYFARYSLALQEREEFKFRPLDLGNFYHRVLDSLQKRLRADGVDFASVDNEQLLSILRGQIAQLIAGDAFLLVFMRRSAHNAYIINSAAEVLEDCVLAFAKMVCAGSFRPILSEITFGEVLNSAQTLGRYELSLSDGRVLSLDGKIDRVDVADIDGKKVAVVFDYKTRGESFDWSKFYHGLDVQLPLYMLALRKAERSQVRDVVGAFYLPVEGRIAITTIENVSEQKEKFVHKAKGIFNGEFWRQLDSSADGDSNYYNFFVTKEARPYGNYAKRGALEPDDFQSVLDFTRTKIIHLAEQILSGSIEVKPYRLSDNSPCSYCVYQPVCRFDWQINDYNPLEAVTKTEVLEKIRNP